MTTVEARAAKLKGVVRRMHPPSAMKRMRKVDGALDDEGRISPYAVSKALSRHTIPFYTSGTLSVTTTSGMEYRVSADGVIERLDIRVKTAPTGQSLKVRLNRNGIALSTAEIVAGAKTAGLRINAACSAGDILTIDITQVGSGTAGSSLSAMVAYREERR